MLIVNTMCKLLAAILAGYYLGRKEILSREVNGRISSLIVQITCPCLIISSISAAEGIERSEVLFLLAAGFVIYLAGPLAAAGIVALFRLPRQARGVYQCMLIFANCIFMGIPVCQSFFGEKAVFYVSVLHIPYNLLFFTLGIWLISRDGEQNMKFSPKQLVNVGVIAALIALILFLGDIRLPEIINGPLSFIGSVTTPLSMMVIGSSIAVYSFQAIFKDRYLYVITVFRLLVIPLTVFGIMHLVTDNRMLIRLVAISLAMPVGTLLVMGASEYRGDVKTASFGVAMTTICSIVTIPLMAIIMGIG